MRSFFRKLFKPKKYVLLHGGKYIGVVVETENGYYARYVHETLKLYAYGKTSNYYATWEPYIGKIDVFEEKKNL